VGCDDIKIQVNLQKGYTWFVFTMMSYELNSLKFKKRLKCFFEVYGIHKYMNACFLWISFLLLFKDIFKFIYYI